MTFIDKRSIAAAAKCAATSVSLVAMMATAGCAVGAGQQEEQGEQVGKADEALTSPVKFFSWGGVINHDRTMFENGEPLFVDLKVGDGWTCLVSGVFGNLTQIGFVATQQNTGFYTNVPIGNWTLAVSGIPGAAVDGAAVCVQSTARPTAQFFPNPPQQFVEGTIASGVNSNTWCGFSSIYSDSGPPYVWNSSSSFATVSDNGLNRDLIWNGSTWTYSEKNGEAEPQCATFSSVGFAIGYILSGPVTNKPLLQSNGSQLPPNTACFLTNVSGSFTNDDFSDGIGATRNASQDWTATLGSGKSGIILCLN
jgi:hypothetical protein